MKRLNWLILAIFAFVLDIGTKILVASRFGMYEERTVIPGFFNLTLTTNKGIAFSLFADVESHWKVVALTAIAVIALGYISWVVWKEDTLTMSTLAGTAIIAGGILGNTANRLWTGSVVDFLDFYVGPYTWPTFNLADTFICVGAGLVIWNIMRGKWVQE